VVTSKISARRTTTSVVGVILPFELGVPESVLSIPSRRSSSASLSSGARLSSRSASRPARNAAASAARSASSSRNRAFAARSPGTSSGTGSSGTRRRLPQPPPGIK
jgi:hypothetical protein